MPAQDSKRPAAQAMAETSTLSLPSRAQRAVWSATLDDLARSLPAERVSDLAQAAHRLEGSEERIRIGLTHTLLPGWIADGSLRLLRASTLRVSANAVDLCVVPLAVEPRPRGQPAPASRFLPSPLNESTLRTLGRWIRPPWRQPRPLLLHGPPGSGKSHLLADLGRALLRKLEPTEIWLCSADALCQDLIRAIRARETSNWRRRLASIRVLLLDDIEILSGRDGIQSELTHVLRDAPASGRLMILTSRVKPGQLPGLESSLQPLPLEPPEWETRIAIVLDRLDQWGLDVPTDSASQIVSLLDPALGDLDTVITRLAIQSAGHASALAPDRLHSLLAQHPTANPSPLPPAAVLRTVCRHFGLRLSDLRSQARSPRLSQPRQIAMYLLRRHCGLSYPELGRRLARHHTTALHSCRRVTERLPRNVGLQETLAVLEKELGQLGNPRV